jgi:hypothetical protein
VTMGATLGWPTATVLLGFLVMTALVVALATSSTARYEFERNGARERHRPDARSHGTHPAGSRSGSRAAGAPDTRTQPQAVDTAVRPDPGPAIGGPAWWLVDEWAQVLAGPFADRIDADWAALADGLEAISVHGTRSADGHVALRPSPEDRLWLEELGDQLDRLPADWDALLTDTDPLTTLLVEVTAAVVEAGLQLHDPQGDPAGGVCLMPDPAARGVLVSWRAHERMSLRHQRGPAAGATVQQSMNVAVADILANLGFVVEPFGATGSSLVTALR